GSKRVWLAGTKVDDGKRFCILQIIARAINGPEDVPRRGQPKIGIIFRGQGLRISAEEKAARHPDVHVRFQHKAWADETYCEEHAGCEMVEATREARLRGRQSVVFYDNLHSQTTDEQEQILLQKAMCVRHFLPTGVTSEIQLIDDGRGYAVKNEMVYALDRWLDQDDNLKLWTPEASDGGFPMWRKRALISHLAAQAWEKVCQTFDCEKAATRIGMRMTIGGSDDEQIKIQGVDHYSFSDEDAGVDSPYAAALPGADPEELQILDSEVATPGDEDTSDEIAVGQIADEGSSGVFHDSSDD
ncbi:MAG: hypothetical protein SGPRY_011741, partial [Prymnesium sp.]